MDTQQLKKPNICIDDEYSDDDENDVVYVPPNRKSLPNMNQFNKQKGYNSPSFKTKMKPVPSLISTGRNNNPNNYSRRDLIMSQVPGLKPIDRTKFFDYDTFRPKHQSRIENFNGTGHRVGTSGSSFGSRDRVSDFFKKFFNSFWNFYQLLVVGSFH